MTPAQLTVVAERWLGWKRECAYFTGTFIAEFKEMTCPHGAHLPHSVPLPDMYSDETFGKLVLALTAAGHGTELSLNIAGLAASVDAKLADANELKERVLAQAYDLATKEQREA